MMNFYLSCPDTRQTFSLVSEEMTHEEEPEPVLQGKSDRMFEGLAAATVLLGGSLYYKSVVSGENNEGGQQESKDTFMK